MVYGKCRYLYIIYDIPLCILWTLQQWNFTRACPPYDVYNIDYIIGYILYYTNFNIRLIYNRSILYYIYRYL